MPVFKVVKGISARWGQCYRTVQLRGKPNALSYGENIFAVGLRLNHDNIIILDATTGSQTAVLSSHTDRVRSLSFSSDKRLLVSGSDNKTVKLWDVQTGGVVKTFYGHTGGVLSVSISVDCATIASGSGDRTIRLWNVQTGQCHNSIKLQGEVDYVTFSLANPGHLISSSERRVQQWDTNGNQTGPTYTASHIAFSPDHTHFALCNGKIVTVENPDSGAPGVELHGTLSHSSCFSPDGRLVAVASDNIVCVWSITNSTPHLVSKFTTQTKRITSLIFSSPSSLISASEDKSVKLWKIEDSSMDQDAIDLKTDPSALAPVQFVSVQAKEGIAISADSDGVVKIWDLLTGLHKRSFQIPVGQIFWGDVRLVDDRLLYVWCQEGKIHIWDSEEGESPSKLKSVCSYGLRISGDGSKVFFLIEIEPVTTIQAWSMWTWELVGEVQIQKEHLLNPFCSGGSIVWVQSLDFTASGWDFGISGASPIPLSDSPSEGYCLEFQQQGGLYVLKNTVTRKEVFRLDGKYQRCNAIQWDGQYLVAGYENGEVLILDFKHFCLSKLSAMCCL